MKRVLGVICVLFFVMGVYGVAGAATVTFDPDPIPDVIVGDTFTVSIIGTDFPATGGGNVVFEWDPSILTITPADITFTWTGDFTGTPVVDVGSGSLSVGVFAGTPPSGTFGIADLMFTASGLGDSFLTISPNTWVEPDLATLIPDVLGASGTITVVAPVPIPGSILLLGSGLVGLVGLVRRRRS